MQHTNTNASNTPELSWKEYVKLAVTTESVPCNTYGMLNKESNMRNLRATRLLHAVLGLCTEMIEISTAITNHDATNIIEELGDIFWYLAIIDDEVKVANAFVLLPADYEFQDGPYYLGEIQDVVKRHIFYGEDLEKENKRGIVPIVNLQICFWGIWRELEDYCAMNTTSISDCLKANIEKLSKRYPSLAFNKEHAVERNVEHELSHIAESVEPHVLNPIDKMFNEIDIEIENRVLKNNQELNIETYSLREESQAISALVGRNEFHLANDAPKTDDVFIGSKEVVTNMSFNHFMRETYTTIQIEKLAMELAFSTAAYYRSTGANGIARAYDGLYSAYSGKGDKLEDFSVFIMWRDLGYPLDKEGIVNKVSELKLNVGEKEKHE